MYKTTINYHFLDVGRNFDYYDSKRSSFQQIYAEYLMFESSISGRVLDIGCGHGINPTLNRLMDKLGSLDGVDPFPVIEPPAHLANRWTCRLEDIPVLNDTYDMAYSYNVVEHVDDMESFLRKLIDIMKPGGVFWSMSPNARHPFTWVTRLMQILRLKKIYKKNINQRANDYPAYYKLSNDINIIHTIEALNLPVSQIDFYYIPNVQWDFYVPKPLKILPNLIDRLFLLKMPKRSFVFMFRLKKQHE
jgi:2-polyprenyl-3-methyl-5-hydroxy-6-metoxy-1,4-benzoquinol methylase